MLESKSLTFRLSKFLVFVSTCLAATNEANSDACFVLRHEFSPIERIIVATTNPAVKASPAPFVFNVAPGGIPIAG